MQQPTDSFIIRDAVEDDIPAVTEIYRPYVETGTMSFELDPPDVDEMLRRYRQTLADGYPYFAMEVAGEIAGYAYAGAYRPRKAYRFTAEESIYLRGDMTGRGLGRPLLEHLLTHLKQDGYRSVIGIVSDPEVNGASVGLHRKLGFREFGLAREIGFKFDRWIDVAYLQLTF